jgi:hypothetical protein
MINASRLSDCFCLPDLRRLGCWFPIVLGLVVNAPRAGAASPALLDYFHACGIGDDAFARFSDDRQVADEELGVIRCIAVRLRDLPIDWLRRMTPPEISATDGDRAVAGRLPTPNEAKSQRGRMFALQGSVMSVEPVRDPDAEPLWRCTVTLSENPHRAVVYVAKMPAKLQAGSAGQRVELDGVFVKYVPGAAAEPMAVIVAPRLQWRGDSSLANLGMDFGLFEGIRDNSPVTAADRDAFYRLLLLARNADRDHLNSDVDRRDGSFRGLSALFRDPASQRGRLVRLSGTARRVVRVPIVDPPIISRLGADHYFEIDIMAEGLPSNPLVFCTLDLPDGMPLSGPIPYGERVEVTGFFVKTWQYPTALSGSEMAANPGSSHALQTAPLVIGPAPLWKPATVEKRSFPALAVGGSVLLAMIGVCLLLWHFRQSDQEFSRQLFARE